MTLNAMSIAGSVTAEGEALTHNGLNDASGIREESQLKTNVLCCGFNKSTDER